MGTDIKITKKVGVKNQNTPITTDASNINFEGSGVTATAVGNDVTVTITGGGGGGSQTLAETLVLGNTTGGENVSISDGDAVILDNGSMLKKGTIDAGYGGAKGISQICAVGYELKWEAGRLYVMGDGGTTIREVSHNFTSIPTIYDDISKGFVVGSRWLLDDGALYLCTDNTDDTAVWELQPNIPTKTSDLINDGDNGTTHFISLQDLPSNLTLYATNAASGISTYTKAVSSITDLDYNTTAVDIPTGALTSETVPTYCGGIVSPANIIIGNPGIFTMSTLGQIRRTAGTAEGTFFYEVYKRTSAGVETLIVTSADTVPISATVYTEFQAAALFNNGVFTDTDRIVIKFYGLRLAGGSDPSFDFQFGGSIPVRTTLPVPLTVVPANGVISVTGTAPVVSSGGLTPAISIPKATVSVDGYLSAADWSVFSAKLGGSGTTSYVPKFTGASTLGNSLIQDDGTSIGIGSTPFSSTRFFVQGASSNSIGGFFRTIASGGFAYGLIGEAFSAATINIGIEGRAINTNSTTNIGGSFRAESSTNNYALQLVDGTQAVGKFLKSVTVDGKTNWSTISVADTGLTLTTTGTSGAATLISNTLNIPTPSSVNIYNSSGALTGARTVDLAGYNLTFNDLLGTGTFAVLTDDNAGSYAQLSVSNGQIFLEAVSSLSGTGKYISVTPTAINIAGYYNLPTSASPSLNQIVYASSTSQLGFTSVKTINGNSILGSGDLVIGGASEFIPSLRGNETYRGISINHNSTTVVSDGGVVMSSSASTLAQSVSSTNFATKQIRLRYYASTVSGGRYTGTRGSALLWYIHGGFKFVCDFNISDTSYSAGCQQFYGLAGQITDLAYGTASNILVSTLTNIIGVGNETGDANLQVFHNDATGTATKVDLGVDFPANRTAGAISTTVYSIKLYNECMSTDVKYEVINKETGAIAQGTLSTNLPLTSQGLNFFASRCMSATSVTNTGQFDLSKLGVYSIL